MSFSNYTSIESELLNSVERERNLFSINLNSNEFNEETIN
jgi:hypothetical protein